MIASQLLLWGIALVLLAALWRRGGLPATRRAFAETGSGLLRVIPLLAVALPMAAMVAALVPPDLAAAWVGRESGWQGILLASIVGGFIPGGPMVTFPLVLTFAKAGAGPAQMVALISGWSVLALHRVLNWEWPLLGARFVVIRLIAGGALPFAAGLLAEALLPLFPDALARF